MRNAETDLTEGTPWKIIMRFSIPLFFTFLLQQFYNMVDTIVVGQFLGKDALAGVGSTGAINFMIIGFCMGLANGFVIPVAQRYGAKDYKDMRRFVANSIWLTVFFAAIMSITVCILCRSVLIAMKTPADILDLAYDYIFIIFAGIPITLAYNLLTGIIRSLGDSKSPLIFLLMAAVANIGFDILSVTVLKLGVRGPAFATLLAQAFSVVLSLWCIKTKFPILKMEPGEWKLHGKHIGISVKWVFRWDFSIRSQRSAVSCFRPVSIHLVRQPLPRFRRHRSFRCSWRVRLMRSVRPWQLTPDRMSGQARSSVSVRD